ncbi:3-dehydroquinate synthase, putative, partial [Ixodes scapularis]
VLVLSSPSGEQFKCLQTIHLYLDSIYEWGADRSSLVICFGGGIPGNIGGLVAGLMYRGIAFIHIPTTLLAAFDSVISLKQAINSNYAKNAIGLYHKPISIYSSAEFFTTLSSKDIRSGICETIKNTLAILPSAIPDLTLQLNNALELKAEAIKLVKDISIKAKQIVMQHDKFEKKKALILEYGHTLGHVIELLDSRIREDSIAHGEAVGLGMLIEAEISYKMGYLSKNDLDTHYDILSKVNIYPILPSDITIDKIIKYVKKDNKRGYISADDNQVGMILLEK